MRLKGGVPYPETNPNYARRSWRNCRHSMHHKGSWLVIWRRVRRVRRVNLIIICRAQCGRSAISELAAGCQFISGSTGSTSTEVLAKPHHSVLGCLTCHIKINDPVIMTSRTEINTHGEAFSADVGDSPLSSASFPPQ